MSGRYLGRLEARDPLYEIISAHVCPDVKDPRFHVTSTSSRSVYKYTEERTKLAIIGKFYDLHDSCEDRINRMKGEYDNLRIVRTYGFDSSPCYVVKPFDKSERIGLAVVEEYVHGKDLDHYLRRAAYEGRSDALKEKLGRLAFFFFMLHQKTATGERPNLEPVAMYFLRVVDKLWRQRVLSDGERKFFMRIMEKWFCAGILDRAPNVTVHGDATPTNFLFTDDGDVVAIDLERLKTADPAFDVSMVCGEIKHAFLWRTGNPYASEPFIEFFLKRYSRHFDDFKTTFRELTLRNPFYMALTELRIARNSYLDWHYRQRLVHEAKECLKWGLRLPR